MTPKIEVFYWNPRRSLLGRGLEKYTRLPWRVNNFGDLIGPLVVSKMLALRDLTDTVPALSRRLMSVGSVLHFADTGDVVWGTGINGTKSQRDHRFVSLDVRAVRGPLTRDYLQARGIPVPEVYGDPALLLPFLMPELVELATVKKHPVTVVPNFLDYGRYRSDDSRLLNPQAPLLTCLRRIAQSELVVGSSLHGIVVAEALGVPARLIAGSEPPFKYLDYYRGSGREGYEAMGTIEEAVAARGEPLPPASFSLLPLIEAFPADLWTARTVYPPAGSVRTSERHRLQDS